MSLTLILGGVRAGKSARALSLAEERAPEGDVLFVATAQSFDEEMNQRIMAHRAERAQNWQTLEEPLDLASAIGAYLDQATPSPSVVVIDCVTLWASNLMLASDGNADVESTISGRARDLIAVMRARSQLQSQGQARERDWIVVSNEVGLGIVPPTLLGRQYRDVLGRVNQLFASAADRVLLMVAGLGLVIKSSTAEA